MGTGIKGGGPVRQQTGISRTLKTGKRYTISGNHIQIEIEINLELSASKRTELTDCLNALDVGIEAIVQKLMVTELVRRKVLAENWSVE